MMFDYFYGNEAEQYQFYMIPQLLFTDNKFKKLSSDAKILYSLLLDRAGLSFKNPDRFQDENGKTFIYFTQEEAMIMLNCGQTKCVDIFSQLDKIGLIEREKQGLGKPVKIYVKHFFRTIPDDDTESLDFQNPKVKTFENRKSRVLKNESLDFQKTKAINTKDNQTNINQNYISQSVSKVETKKSKEVINNANRQTDRQDIKKSFTDIMKDIGYTKSFNEDNLIPTDIELKKCRLPLEYHNDKETLKETINILVKWDYIYNSFKDDVEQKLYANIVKIILEFLSNENTRFKNKNINYADVFRAFNQKISIHGNMYSWIALAMEEWKNVLKTQNIGKPLAYLKSCIWTWLSTDELEQKETVYVAGNSNIYSSKEVITPKKETSYDLDEYKDFIRTTKRNMGG